MVQSPGEFWQKVTVNAVLEMAFRFYKYTLLYLLYADIEREVILLILL